MMIGKLHVMGSALLVGSLAVLPATRVLVGQEPRALTVAAALKDANGDRVPDRLGQRVALVGVLTSDPVVVDRRASRVTLQDSTGAIRLFTRDTLLLFGHFRETDSVLVRGTVGQHRGMEELVIEDIRRLGVGSLPVARDVLVADLYRERYQTQLVRLAGELTIAADSGAKRATVVLRDRSGEIRVVLPSRFFADRRIAGRLAKGGHVVLTGLAEQRDDTPPFDSGYRVRPRTPADLEFAPLPPYRAISIAVVVLLLVGAALYGSIRRRRAERRGAEMAHLASVLRATLESTADGILVVDRHGKIVTWNRTFLSTWSIPESVMASGDDDRVLAFVLEQLKDGDGFLSRVKALYSQPEAESADILEFRDGRVFERYSRPQYLEDAVVGRVWSFRDVTQRERTYEALRVAEGHYRSLIENAPYGIYCSTVDGRLEAANPALVALLGYDSAEELLGRELASTIYVDPSERDRLIAAQGQRPWIQGVEVAWKRKDGKPVHVRLSGRTVRTKQGAVEGFEGFVEDITAHASLEAQLRQAQKMEAVGRLAGGVAHDFNNLLTVIMGSADLLLDELASDSVQHGEAADIKKAASRAATLTRQLLAFSRRQALAPKVLDLNAAVADTVKLLRRLVGEDIELATVSRGGSAQVRVDPGQLQQVLMNLVVNARDAMPRGGSITIETDVVELDDAYAALRPSVVPGRYVMLAVCDTGTGMDQATQAHLFEPFFTTKETGKGTGLGLATVYGIVQQSGGHIWVYSEPGEGSTFKIYLPLIAEPGATEPAETGVADRRGGSETILLVEDEPGVRALARRILRARGYTLLEAADGEEALRVASGHAGTIELLLTDVMMPRMPGRELARRMVETRPEIRILYTSGYTDDTVIRQGVLEPGTAFLQKPFTPDLLAQRVRELLDGLAASPAASAMSAAAA